MTNPRRPVNNHKAYHAHVYFDESTRTHAKQVCEAIKKTFELNVGTFHEKNVGPHPRWSCQIIFGTKDFDTFIPWLDSKRDGLTVLVHALTGDDLADHTDYAYWLGDAVDLNLGIFQQKEPE